MRISFCKQANIKLKIETQNIEHTKDLERKFHFENQSFYSRLLVLFSFRQLFDFSVSAGYVKRLSTLK